MKKKFVKVLSLYLFSSTCFACTSTLDNLVDAGTPIIDSSPALVAEVKATTHFLGWGNVGDTTIKVKPDKDVLPALTGKKVDLAALSANAANNAEGGFRMISVGGSLSAGFRDGGLYREGQLTAFPNLVARQMGVILNQPLFDATDGNGSGYKTLAGTEPIASFKMVTNNLGYADSKAEKLKAFKGNSNDQFAFPQITKRLDLTPFDQKYVERLIGSSTKSNYKTPLEWIGNESADFAIFEFGTDDLVRSILSGGGGGINSFFGGAAYFSTEFGLMKKMSDNKTKGIILNAPDVLDFPYFNQFTTEKVKKLGVKLKVQKSASSENYRDFDFSIDRIVPTAKTEKLFTNKVGDIIELSDKDVLSAESGDNEVGEIVNTFYNTNEVIPRARELNWPIVDIYGLYKKILAGSFTTDDGVKVNPDWAKGNFFSADGIYLTAFGQSIIANEVIKTMNQHYKLAIPLVDTRFFLKK
jgi:hypothetical protein